jgi:hypothetical protein
MKMENTKIITLSAITSVLAVALIGVAYAQNIDGQGLSADGYYSSVPKASGSAQGYNGIYGYSDYHHPDCYHNDHYPCPEQSSYSYGTPQGGLSLPVWNGHGRLPKMN